MDGPVRIPQYDRGRLGGCPCPHGHEAALVSRDSVVTTFAGVKAPIAPYHPDQLGMSADAVKRKITIGDLLTMRSGRESASIRNYGAWLARRATPSFTARATTTCPLGFALAQRPQYPQGIYFDGNEMLTTPRRRVTHGWWMRELGGRVASAR